MGKNIFIFSLAFMFISLNHLSSIKASENSFNYFKLIDVHELQIQDFKPAGVVDCIDWNDSDRIVFSDTDVWEGKFSHIYVCDTEGKNFKKLTDANGIYTQARWILGDKIAYIDDVEHEKLLIMDINGNDASFLLAEEIRNICRYPWLLSNTFGFIQDHGNEIVLFSGQESEKRLSIPEHKTHILRASGSLICDEKEFVLGQCRPQYKMFIQRTDIKDGTIHDIALYKDPSVYSTQTFTCSKDGSMIAYISGSEIWIMNSLGANSQCIYSVTEKSLQYGAIAFSPKGDKIVFSYRDLKGDRQWRIWIGQLKKESRPARLFDKLEAIVISETNTPNAISIDDILSLSKEQDPRISIQEINLDFDTQKELMAILQRQEEKDVIVLNFRSNQYFPIWTIRCFFNTEIQTLGINKTDDINAIVVHTDSMHHGINDNCCIYRFTSEKAELIWHQMLTNIDMFGYKGKIILDDGAGYKDLIAKVDIHYPVPGSLVIPIDEPIETITLRYTWDGNQYIGDEIEKRVNDVTQQLKQP
jgi:hypothetical protein